MPLLKRACCYLELGFGALILGYGSAFASIIIIVVTIFLFNEPNIRAVIPIVIMTAGILQLIVSILLIRGAMTKNRRLILSWIIVTLIDLILVNLTLGLTIYETGAVAFINLLGIFDLTVCYFWARAYSFYQELSTKQSDTNFVLDLNTR